MSIFDNPDIDSAIKQVQSTAQRTLRGFDSQKKARYKVHPDKAAEFFADPNTTSYMADEAAQDWLKTYKVTSESGGTNPKGLDNRVKLALRAHKDWSTKNSTTPLANSKEIRHDRRMENISGNLDNWSDLFSDDGFDREIERRGLAESYNDLLGRGMDKTQVQNSLRRKLFTKDLAGKKDALSQARVSQHILGLEDQSDDAYVAGAQSWVSGRVKTREEVSAAVDAATDVFLFTGGVDNPNEDIARARQEQKDISPEALDAFNRTLLNSKKSHGDIVPLALQLVDEVRNKEGVGSNGTVLGVEDGSLLPDSPLEMGKMRSSENLSKLGEVYRRGDRDKFLYLLGRIAEERGSDVDGTGDKLLRSIGRGFGAMADSLMVRKAMAGAEQELREAGDEKSADILKYRLQVFDDIKNLGQEVARVKGSNMVTQGIYDAAQSLPYMAMMANPGTLVASALAIQEDHIEEMQKQNPNLSRDKARGVAAVSSAIEVSIERLQFGTAVGRLPGISKAIKKLSGGGLLRRLTLVSGAEYTQETVQEAVLPTVQEIVNVFDAQVPEGDWDNFKVMDSRRFFAVLPISLLGGGGQYAAEKISGADPANQFNNQELSEIMRDSAALRLVGFSKEEAAEISKVALNDPRKAVGMMREQRGEQTPEAREEAGQKAAREIFGEVVDQGQEQDGDIFEYIPKVRPTGDGKFQITFTGGDVQIADSKEEVQLIVEQRTQEEFNDSAQAVRDRMDNLLETSEGDNKAEIAKPRTFQELADLGVETVERLKEAVAVSYMQRGEATPENIDLNNYTEQGSVTLRRKMAGFAVRLAKDKMTLPTTVDEEFSEGFLRLIVEQGETTFDEVKTMLDEFGAIAGIDMTQGYDVDPNRAVIEGFSKFAKAYMLQGDHKSIPKSSQAWYRKAWRVLENPDSVPAPLRAFAELVTKLLRSVFDVAQAIKSQKQDGKGINPELEGLAMRALGLNEQQIAEEAQAQYEQELQEELGLDPEVDAELADAEVKAYLVTNKSGGRFVIVANNEADAISRSGLSDATATLRVKSVKGKKVDSARGMVRLADIALREGRLVTRMTRDQYVEFAITHGVFLDGDAIRMSPTLRDAKSVVEAYNNMNFRDSHSPQTASGKAFEKVVNFYKSRAESYLKIKGLADGVARTLNHADGWVNFRIKGQASRKKVESQLTHKGYFDFGQNFGIALTHENIGQLFEKLGSAGFNGQVKFGEGAIQMSKLADQLVIHGDTKADADIGVQVAEAFFREKGDQLIVDVNRGVDDKSKKTATTHSSYSEILSERTRVASEKKASSSPSFSITPAQDAEYLAAVESGDVETQQSMVDEAAKAAGYKEKGVRVGIYRDGTPLLPEPSGNLGAGYYAVLDGNKDDIREFAGPIIGEARLDTTLKQSVDNIAIDLGDKPIFRNDERLHLYVREQGLSEQFEAWQEYEAAWNAQYKKTGVKRPDSLNGRRGGRLYKPSQKYLSEQEQVYKDEGFSDKEIRERLAYDAEVKSDQSGLAASFLFDQGLATAIVVDWSKADIPGGRKFKEVAVANPSQIKSAEPVTRDPAGNVIPLSQRFDQSRDEISFSITPAQDAEYLAAVESGDVETQQRMVDEAAKKAGYWLKALHQTTSDEFEVFDMSRMGSGIGGTNSGFNTPSAFFTIDGPKIRELVKKLNIGMAYGNREISVFLKPDESRDYIPVADLSAQKKGVDQSGYEIAITDPNRIKSADPITRDANGNVIPLSQRFDQSRDEISFSITPKDAEYLELAKNPEKNRSALQKLVDAAAKAAGYDSPKVYHGTNSEKFEVFERDGFPLYFFSENEGYAKSYGNRVVSAYLKYGKFKKIDREITADETVTSSRVDLWKMFSDKFSGDEAIDTLISTPSKGNQETAVKSPNQIKSADPITRDANGNVIPLSQRFDQSRDEISFSITPKDEKMSEAVERLFAGPKGLVDTGRKLRSKLSKIREKFEANLINAEGRDKDTRELETLNSLMQLNALRSVMPKEVRDSVGSPLDLVKLKTAKPRERNVIRRLEKMEKALNKYHQRKLREKIEKAIKKSKFKVSGSRKREGKIGQLGHNVVEHIESVKGQSLQAAEASKADLTQTFEEIEAPTSEEFERWDSLTLATDLFYDYENATTARLEQALDFVTTNYKEGRKEWLAELQRRREERDQFVKEAISFMGDKDLAEIGEIEASTIATNESRKGINKFTEGVAEFLFSNHHTLARIVENAKDKKAAKDWHNRLLDSRIQGDLKSEQEADKKQEEFNEKLREIVGAKGKLVDHKVNKFLYEAKQARINEITVLEVAKTEEVAVPEDAVGAILRGETNGFDGEVLSDTDIELLRDAVAEFDKLPKKKQGKNPSIKFTRVISEGARKPVGKISHEEALQWWLTMRQPDQREKLEKLGWDEQMMEELSDFIPDDVKELGLWMSNNLVQEGAEISSIHAKEYGVELNTGENYFPVQNKTYDSKAEIDLNDPGSGRGISTASLKERVVNKALPAQVGAFGTYLRHVTEMAYWKHNVSWVRQYGGAFKTKEFAKNMEGKVGVGAYKTLSKYMESVSNKGAAAGQEMMGAERFLKGMMSRAALAILGSRLSTIWINSTAFLNALGSADVSATQVLRYSLSALIDGKGAMKETWRNELAVLRRDQGSSFLAQAAMKTGKSGHWLLRDSEKVAQLGMVPMNVMDVATNTVTMAGIYRATEQAALKRGATPDVAKAEADTAVTRAHATLAQPALGVSKSLMEQKSGSNPFMAMMIFFMSEVRKNTANNYIAWRTLFTGKGIVSRTTAARQAALYTFIYTAFVQGFRAIYNMLTGDEEKDEEVVQQMQDPKFWMYAAASDNLAAIPIGGEVVTSLLAKPLDQKYWDRQSTFMGAAKQISQASTVFDEDETDSARIDEAIDFIQSAGSLLPGGPLFAQAGNVADFAKKVAEGGMGYSFSEADRVQKIRKGIEKNKKAIYEENEDRDTRWELLEDIANQYKQENSDVWDKVMPQLEEKGVLPSKVIKKLQR